MSTTFDSIVKDMIKNREVSISRIDAEKNKQILPYGYRPELRDTFNNIIKEDPDYIRRYLKTSSNIAYQTDVYIDSKETRDKMMYKSAFNNDSVYLNFGGDKLLVTCLDSSVASDNYDFYTDVFVNGRKLKKSDYIEMPSDKHYNFKTGAIRFFIDAGKADIGDTISVVIRKEPKCKSYYTTLVVHDPKKTTYFIDKHLVGRYGENIDTGDNDLTALENLLIYKKHTSDSGSYFKLDTQASVKEYIGFLENVKGTISLIDGKADIKELPSNVAKNDAYKVVTAGTYGKHECSVGDILFALSSTETSTDENWGRIPFNIQKKSFILDLSNCTNDNGISGLNDGDTFLIINRAKHMEYEVSNETKITLDEYLKYSTTGTADKSIRLPLVDKNVKVEGCDLPLPVKSINDIEIFVGGYRAINGTDFIFINDENCNQYVLFNGILRPDSVVTYRNKCIDTTYNFYDKVSLHPVDGYVKFDEELIYLLSNDEDIENNIEVGFLTDYTVIPYKEEYKNYKDSFNYVKMIRNTASTVLVLEENDDVETYERVNIGEESFILYDESFGESEVFEYVDLIILDDYVKSLIIERKIFVRGLSSFKGEIYTRYEESYGPHRHRLTFMENSEGDIVYSYGVVDLSKKVIPICENYIEAYVGRRRVPISEKRSIINRYLKIDNQHTTFDDIEIYSEINWTDYAKTIIEMLESNELGQNVYTQLYSIDNNSIIVNNWLDLVYDIKYNDEVDKNKAEDIFYARLKNISFDIANQAITQYEYPKLKVLGFYDKDAAGIDITSECIFRFFDNHGNMSTDFNTEDIGDQYVIAILKTKDVTEESLPKLTFHKKENDIKKKITVDGTNVVYDNIVIKVRELRLDSIEILSNTNFFTTDDNILKNIRVIGTYENGSKKVIDDCDNITVSSLSGTLYPDGIVNVENKYIITATHDGKSDTITILVESPDSKKVTHLDVIPTTRIDSEDSTVLNTSLSIYATFINNQVQKIENDTVNVYMYERNLDEDTKDTVEFLDTFVKDENGENKVYDADCIRGLELNTNYKFAICVYTNDSKTDVIAGLNSDYTDVTFKLFDHPIKDNSQTVYFDNLTAKLSTDFVGKYSNDSDYYYYSIKNLDGIYLSLGQGILNSSEGVMTISSLALNEMVVVEFYSKELVLTNQLLFTVIDSPVTYVSADGEFRGNIVDGYEITINKVNESESYEGTDFIGSKILDGDRNVIVTFDTNAINANNNYIRNSIDKVFVYFKNFNTKSGNVAAISNYIEQSKYEGKPILDLYFEIPTLNKTVELHVPSDLYTTSEFEVFEWTELDVEEISISKTLHEDEKWLVIEPELPIGKDVVKVIEIKPSANSISDITNSGNNIAFQLRMNSNVGEFESMLDINRCGLNRYCYITKENEIYYIDVTIKQHESSNIAILDSINGVSFESIETTNK